MPSFKKKNLFEYFVLVMKYSKFSLREGCGKSKWKFKMAFAMKGGGGLEGVLSATYLF